VDDLRERRIGDLTVRIDRGLCIASGNCMKLAPEVFEFDVERVCSFRDKATEGPSIDRERLLEACRVCPVDALLVFDAQGRRIVP
jgi:ferredoxin